MAKKIIIENIELGDTGSLSKDKINKNFNSLNTSVDNLESNYFKKTDVTAQLGNSQRKVPSEQAVSLALKDKASQTSIDQLSKAVYANRANIKILSEKVDNKADKSDVSIGLINKGSVSIIENLPKDGNIRGDAYYVESEGFIYQYDGAKWNQTIFTAFPSNIANAKEVDRINNIAPDKIINLEYKNTIGYKSQNIKYDFLQGEKYIFEIRGCNNNPPLTVRLMKDFTSNVSSVVQSLQTVTEDGIFEFVCNTSEAVNIQILTYTAESTTWNATFNLYYSKLTVDVLQSSKAIEDISNLLDQSTPLLRYDNAAKDIVIDGFYNPNYTEIFNKSELKLTAYKTGTYQEAKFRLDNLIVGEKLSFTIKERSFNDPEDNRFGGIYFFDANDNSIASSGLSNEITIPEHKYAMVVLFLNRKTPLNAKTVVTFKGISLKYASHANSSLPNLWYDNTSKDKVTDGYFSPSYTEIFNKSELKLIAYKTGQYQEAKLRLDNLIVGEKLSFTIKERSFFDPLDNRFGGIYFFDANDKSVGSSSVSNEIIIPEHKYAMFVLFLNRKTPIDDKTVVTFKGISLRYTSQTNSSLPTLWYDNASKDKVIDGFYDSNYTEIFNKSELKLTAYKTGQYQEAKLRLDNLIVGEKLSLTIKERSFKDPLDNRFGGIYFFDANDKSVGSSSVSNEIIIPEHKYAMFVLFLNRKTPIDDKTVVTFKGISLKYVSQTNSSLPNYYDKYLDDKIKAINTVTRESTGKSDSFLFFTDIHAKSNAMLSPALINEVLASTTCNKVVCGWDAIEAYGTKDDILSQYNSLNKLINTYISPYSDVLSSRGNHDFTIKTNSNDPGGYTFTQQNTRNMIFKKTENKFVFNEADQSGCYYYYDNKLQGIRYIVLDSCDTVNSGDVAFGVQYVVSKTQMDWIAGNAVMTTPAGYGIVFIMHIPVTDTTGDSGGHQNFTNVLTLVESVQNKTSNVTINDSVYDFSRLNVNVLMTLSGHMHNDLQTYKNGVLHIVSASDAFYQDYKESPFFINPPTRGKGNTTEQLIDFINIDKSDNVIKAIRIGAGYDRTFNLQKHSLTIGNNVTLSSKLSGALTWKSYNSVGNTKKNKVWNMVNDVVSVNNGTVTALKAGEAVVFAMDQNQNKEFFYIAVN